jgi:hypothetical protein
MNYIKHLTGFFNCIAVEKSLNPTHISLYITIFQCWNINRFKNPIAITRDEMMRGSKISSTATFHKCIKDLQRLGYLDYNPSFNPYSGTSITIHSLLDGSKLKSEDYEATCSINEQTSSKIEQADTLTCSKNELTPSKIEQVNTPTCSINELTPSKIEQVSEQANEHVTEQVYIYNKKTYTNNINLDIEPEFEILNDHSFLENQEKKEKEKSSAKKEMLFAFADTDEKKIKESRQKEKNETPTLELVKEYFKFQENTEFEAERYFNYYSSNGWLIGGKSKMKDWKAAARNWMLNTSKFAVNITQHNPVKEQTRAQNLHTVTDKNYAEPL